MRNQRNEWHTLAELIAEKVQEYIDEAGAWEEVPCLWVDGNSSEVNLGLADEEYPGEKHTVSFFIVEGAEGSQSPDYDKIDDYASGWFDLRLA